MSLSDRLRAAALDRAEKTGQTIDGVVLEPTGVIDLREMARSASRDVEQAVDLPEIGEASTVRELYSDDRPLTNTALWRRLRPLPTDDVTLDLTDDEPTVALERDTSTERPTPTYEIPFRERPEAVVIDLTEPAPLPPPAVDAPLGDEPGRPTALCDQCGSFGQRDLFDRFSQTEYYSCDDCGHMWQQRRDAD